jgi:hypothetical protein
MCALLSRPSLVTLAARLAKAMYRYAAAGAPRLKRRWSATLWVYEADHITPVGRAYSPSLLARRIVHDPPPYLGSWDGFQLPSHTTGVLALPASPAARTYQLLDGRVRRCALLYPVREGETGCAASRRTGR